MYGCLWSIGTGRQKSQMLLTLLALAEDVAVAFHDLTDEQEGVYGRHAVGDQSGHPFALADLAALDKETVPELAELLVLLLQLGGQLSLALTNLVERGELLMGRKGRGCHDWGG